MLGRLHNLRIKHKFILMSVFFLCSGVVADIGLYEVYKTNIFQRLEREHLGHLGTIAMRVKELEHIKKPAENQEEISSILSRESHQFYEMGLIQSMAAMKSVAESFLTAANPIEKILFTMIGFGEAFYIAEKDCNDIALMQQTVEDYKRHRIPYDRFLEKLIHFTENVRKYDDEFNRIVNRASRIVSAAMISVGAIVLMIVAAFSVILYKGAMRPLNEAKNNIYASSQELQANSKQQLQSASSQTSAISEISSVMQELVATSRQVSESSSRANALAKDTNSAVKEGHVSLDQAMEGTHKIKEKMEIISSNMISLGEKSQQIGIVLDLINELSQQVTVLSYNATIEAAGAGEMGKRFMAVADRIIKLAERSVESAKEIKSIIDDVQTDSAKTIMSTEDGMKAVEKGIADSSTVKESLYKIDQFTKQVLASVDEIYMSLNQQKTGVEQAAAEVEDISVLVRENEDGSKQVMETADQLLDMAEMLEKM